MLTDCGQTACSIIFSKEFFKLKLIAVCVRTLRSANTDIEWNERAKSDFLEIEVQGGGTLMKRNKHPFFILFYFSFEWIFVFFYGLFFKKKRESKIDFYFINCL